MGDVGLYLSGAGSLDGSDVISAVLAYQSIQQLGHDPVPVGRDINQGRVVDHRTARTIEESRNALSEAARVVRGNVEDMRDVDTNGLIGAILVGGDGTLSTWTDYHERGDQCRVTERLKYHVLDLFKADKPLVCFGNAGFVTARILRDADRDLTVNVGNNSRLNETLRNWGVDTTDESPYRSENRKIGYYPEATRNDHLPETVSTLTGFLDRFFD